MLYAEGVAVAAFGEVVLEGVVVFQAAVLYGVVDVIHAVFEKISFHNLIFFNRYTPITKRRLLFPQK